MKLSVRDLPALEESALAALLFEVKPRLGAILGAFRVPTEDAEDLLQDALLAFVLKAPRISSPPDWLAEALRLRCRQYVRTRIRHRTRSLDDLQPKARDGESEERANRHIDLQRELRQLPGRSRSVLYFRFWVGLDDEEIASRTGYSRGSLDTTRRRALASLRSGLGRGIADPS